MNDLGYFPSQKKKKMREKQEASVLKSSQNGFSSEFKSYLIINMKGENALTCLLHGKMPSMKEDPFIEK